MAQTVSCVPYDVINTKEARKMAEGLDWSFLHVIRPEIDLPADTWLYDPEVYETGARNLQKMQEEGILIQDKTPQIYLYQQQMGNHIQTGIYTCVSVKDYDQNRILKHELTRPDKEDDRTRHILAQNAHAEPVMLTFKPNDAIREKVKNTTENSSPVYDFTAPDGVVHRVWAFSETEAMAKAFRSISHLYVADGHHRCKSASRVAEILRKGAYGEDEFEFFPAVLIPMDEMRILPYHRIVKKVPSNFLNDLKKTFSVSENASPKPSGQGEISLYLEGKWYEMELPRPESDHIVAQLDVSRLHEAILRPLLGIEDQRTDANIAFVGGIRGYKELERLVNEKEAGLAISMYATRIEELMAVSDQNQLMPPKSTWFEPKLRSGLLVHTF